MPDLSNQPLTEGSNAEVTIDELAREASLPASTVRLYQNKGLLPPPERRGRVGYYDERHRDRLRLIAHLQERGFSLAAIKEALDSWDAGKSLDHLLGVADVAPGLTRRPLRLSPTEVLERFAGVEVTQEHLQRAAAVGLIEFDGADLIVHNAAFADVGPAVAKLGIPVEVIIDEYAALSAAVEAIALRFKGVFDRHVWSVFEAEGMPADKVPELTSDVNQLTDLATSVVALELADHFATFAAEYVERAVADRE